MYDGATHPRLKRLGNVIQMYKTFCKQAGRYWNNLEDPDVAGCKI